MGYKIIDQRNYILEGVALGIRDRADVDRFGFILEVWDGNDTSCVGSISLSSREEAEAYYILCRLSE